MRHPLLFILFFITLMSCGKSSGGSKSGAQNSDHSEPRREEQTAEGSYRAIMRPMNNSLSGFLPTGATEVDIMNDQVIIKTYLDDDARVTHLQNVHTGSRCPSAQDDLNKDGLIDIKEAYKVVGKILIPLDADISSLEDGAGIYPLGGAFTYEESTPLSVLQNDVKKRVGEHLNLHGRVVLMHGVNGATKISETVATTEEMLRQASIPIVCGIIRRK